jgi:hypothetical protein
MLASLGIGGCASWLNDVDRTPPWNQKQWREAQEENQERLAGEDAPKSPFRWAGLPVVWNGFSAGVGNLWSSAIGNTPAKNARKLHDSSSPDMRREGIIFFSNRDYGRRDPYVMRYSQMAADDGDFTVRAMAIRAMNRSRDRRDTPIYIKAMDDSQSLVRLEAAKALANIPDERATPVLIKHLNDTTESKDVRIAAADALRSFKTSEVAQALIGTLQDRDFGVAWQAHKSLEFITGRDLHYDQAAWLAYLTGPQKPLG